MKKYVVLSLLVLSGCSAQQAKQSRFLCVTAMGPLLIDSSHPQVKVRGNYIYLENADSQSVIGRQACIESREK